LTILGAGLVAGSAQASDVALEIEVPRLNVAEYHRPYVAVWVAQPNNRVAANLAVWYQLDDGPEGEGKQWLKDIRQWWRRTGRSLELPIDGVSGPTRAPGTHSLSFSGDAAPFGDLPPGDYVLHVEAAREVGGRELLRIPFTWGMASAFEQTIEGETELGTVSLKLIPTD
jgi:hypothetical protein